MIWITTLCLLAVALWLFFNALNERRWVEAHSHDETVASDEGLLPSLTGLTKTANPSSQGGTPGTPLERAAKKLKTGSEKLGEQVTDAKKSAAEMYERAKQSDGALGKNSTVGRLVSKTREKASVLNQKLDAGMKSASGLTTASSDGNGQSFLNKAAATSGRVTQKVAQRVKSSADNLSGKTNASGDESVISKIAGKVSDGMSAVDQKLDRSDR
ncbi:MAG: hypothetical protein ACI9UN_005118 [Granulosicoccus sp.]|jgi:hypothetical protein